MPPPHTILVVDDEPANVRAVARTLRDEHRVVTATRAAEGLALLAAEPIALLIVDQRMPEMTGTAMLARSAAHRPEVIRVLLTGYTDTPTLLDAINAGHVYAYVTKPWDAPALQTVVRRGLEHYDAEADRRRLLAELDRACARLRREADQKGRLLDVAAHELGTPLHLMSSALGFIEEAPLPPALRPWLATARRGVDWMGRCLAQLLHGARWSTRPLPLQIQRVALPALLASLASAYTPIAAARRLTLQLDLPAVLPEVDADPRWLSRALSNLLSNAIRFTPDGGVVRVTAAAAPDAVDLCVADTGIGIAAPLLEELFEPFSAAGGDLALHTSGRFEFGARGLGLGLAITKAIVAQHGGTITVRSAPGAGSEFQVRLPAEPARG